MRVDGWGGLDGGGWVTSSIDASCIGTNLGLLMIHVVSAIRRLLGSVSLWEGGWGAPISAQMLRHTEFEVLHIHLHSGQLVFVTAE